jgi:predicted membrane-bound spermidine synthase
MIAALCLVFLVSGAAALVFETLWFRQAGLALGNTVWASALVTASFMAGLAIGNAAVARWGRRSPRPLAAYAALELVVAVTGVGLVFLFPLVGQALAPLMGSLGGTALNALRVVVAFALLLVPSTAMGATLPLLAGALSARDPNFGRVLGRLYGWNTLGAFLGTLLGDLVLIGAVGIRGTAFAAAGLNLVAAAGAMALAPRFAGDASVEPVGTPARIGPAAWRLLAAAFLSGGILLALEVVWFRFLLSFTPSSSWVFAVMLAVVLLGIAAGGLVAGSLLGRRADAHRWAAPVALLAGLGVSASYASFLSVVPPTGADVVITVAGYFRLAVPLMFPVSLLSGVLFTLLGRALHGELGESTRSAGLLTLANTVGAATGALAGGFLVLPALGVERALFVLACLYVVVGLLALAPGLAPRERVTVGVAGALLALAVALFPFGLMANQYIPRIVARYANESYRVVAYEEALGETVMIARRDSFGQPDTYRLITNGMAMSGTTYVGRRFMALYVWLPVATHPGPRRALQISYGLGTTSRALVETRELERIDIVDTSAATLRLSALAQESPAQNPLTDPRVHVHVEDGRFFLLTTPLRYDIITADPPPPKAAGISSLYSREYFGLVRSRLAEGGMATYWLPVYQMEPVEAKAVIAGFCAAFDDCSLWTGYGLEWILAGTREAKGPVSAERFSAQWRDPVVSKRLREAGFDDPSLLGATFLADAPALRSLVAGTPPLDDDHPYRLSPVTSPGGSSDLDWFARFMQIEQPMQRFFESELVRRLWPEAWREPTRASFYAIDAMNATFLGPQEPGKSGLRALEHLLSRTSLYAPTLWATGTNAVEVRLASEAIARGEGSPLAEEILGLDALARRDYREADRRLGLAEPHATTHAAQIRMWRVLALGLAGDKEGCARLLDSAGEVAGSAGDHDPAPWRWLAQRFGLPDPTTARSAG